MNIQQLKIFIAIVEHRKLSLAAEKLQLTQPTLTFHLKALQQTLGTSLFEEHLPHRWILNKAGKILYPYAKQMIQLQTNAVQEITHLNEFQRTLLKIGASETTATYILPSYLATFQKHHEDYKISLTVQKAPTILEKIKKYELQIAIIAHGPIKDDDLYVLPLAEDPLVIAVEPNHPLAAIKQLKVEDLLPYPFLLHEQQSTSYRLAKEWMDSNSIPLNITMEIGSIQALKEAAEAGIGAAILPKLSLEKELIQNRLVALPLPQYTNKRFIYSVQHKEHLFENTIYNTFIQFIHQKLAN